MMPSARHRPLLVQPVSWLKLRTDTTSLRLRRMGGHNYIGNKSVALVDNAIDKSTRAHYMTTHETHHPARRRRASQAQRQGKAHRLWYPRRRIGCRCQRKDSIPRGIPQLALLRFSRIRQALDNCKEGQQGKPMSSRKDKPARYTRPTPPRGWKLCYCGRQAIGRDSSGPFCSKCEEIEAYNSKHQIVTPTPDHSEEELE